MDVGLCEASEAEVKAHERLNKYGMELARIKRQLCNGRIPEKKRSVLRRRETEVIRNIVDVEAKFAF